MRSSPGPVMAAFVLALAIGALVAAIYNLLSWGVAVAGAASLMVASTATLWAPGLLGVPLFTRLERGRLLDDGLRPRIVELLRTEPGLGIIDVCGRLSIGWGTAVHHLTRLEGAGLVTSQDSGRRRRFFVAGETPLRRTALCVLSTDLNRRLLERIRDRPGLSQTELCESLGISAPLAHKYLARLIQQGLVRSSRQWRNVQYFVADSVPAAFQEYAQAQAGLPAPGPVPPPAT